jgi:hypothetical protein
MEVELSNLRLPAQSEIKIEISVEAHLGVTAQSAQRKVSKLLLEQVGNLVYGESPNLVAGERMLWRVPVWVASPQSGPLGKIGNLDVDVQSGEILYSQEMLDMISEQGRVLAQHSPSNTN